MSKICPQCGTSFIPRRKEQFLCSNECQSANRKKPVTQCLFCGKDNPKPGLTFCCRQCYDKYREDSRPHCEQCGKRLPSRGKWRFCSLECRLAALRPKARPCINCGTVFTPIKVDGRTGKYHGCDSGKSCSRKCQIEWIKRNPKRKEKISAAFTGANHPNWQGGKSAINICAHRGSGWQRIAEKARDRDKRVCRVCGKTEAENGRKMDVHHIKAYHDINYSKKANKLSNLISLCQSCHRKEENKIQNQQIVLPFAKIAQDNRRTKRAAVFTKA